MYETGHQIGRAVADVLGLKGKGGNALSGAFGGAAAGFSLGGLPGAAIGAVVGGVLGFMKKIPKLLGSTGTVVVGANGVAKIGTTSHVGKTTDAGGEAAAGAGASLFNQFAANFGAKLAPGNYGTFGQHQWTKGGAMESFYSTTGILGPKYGFPQGVEGVDWVKGTDSQVQAFALITQVKKGLITGLTDTMRTIFQNTKAKDMESLQNDLQVGEAYDEFVKNSYKLGDVASKVRDLNTAFYKLKQQAAALGLSENKLASARQRLMTQMKNEFNYGIQQGILGYTNPGQASYNDLVKEYHDAVEAAMAVGGDLAAVEKYYGLKRVEIVKQLAEQANNGLVAAAKDLYDQLTASSSSPLNTQTVFGNARDLYSGLTNEFAGGNFANVDKLSGYVQNYLDAARSMYGSSTDYFDIFKQVTDSLNQYQTVGGGTSSAPGIPDLPSLDAMVQEINSSSLEMIGAMGTVGQAVVEGSTNIVDAINNLAIALGYQLPAPTPTVPTGPTSGGTGVGDIGTPYPGQYNVYDGGGGGSTDTNYGNGDYRFSLNDPSNRF
jgi:hypothetical protein